MGTDKAKKDSGKQNGLKKEVIQDTVGFMLIHWKMMLVITILTVIVGCALSYWKTVNDERNQQTSVEMSQSDWEAFVTQLVDEPITVVKQTIKYMLIGEVGSLFLVIFILLAFYYSKDCYRTSTQIVERTELTLLTDLSEAEQNASAIRKLGDRLRERSLNIDERSRVCATFINKVMEKKNYENIYVLTDVQKEAYEGLQAAFDERKIKSWFGNPLESVEAFEKLAESEAGVLLVSRDHSTPKEVSENIQRSKVLEIPLLGVVIVN